MNSKEQIKAWLSYNEWSESDKQAFLDFVENDGSGEVRNLLESEFLSDSNAIIAPDISGRMLEKIHLEAGITQKTKIVKFWKPLAAAASVILILLSTMVYFNNSQKVQKLSAVTKPTEQKDIAPGGNRAILTLADGQTIVLDSAQNGLLSSQGNTQVVKLENGKLAYEQSASRYQQSGISNQVSVIQFNTISTPRGGQYQVALADGSQVWLNAESSIIFPTSFTGNTREVTIKGEAYFEVAHNAKMPFTVKVNDMEVQVLGTHFNINSYEDEGAIKTTLLEGSVKVKHANQDKIIIPGQQLILDNRSGKMVVENKINTEEVMAWKNGKFYFHEANIHFIMKQVARWYDVEVEYTGEVNKIFEGTISRQVSASNIFKILSATGGVHFSIEGKKVIVSP
ncbi:MAG: FecR domain-containing protein [Ginsengibacter sp.]